MIAHFLIACGVTIVLIVYGEMRYESGYQRRIKDRETFEQLVNDRIAKSIDLAEADLAAREFIASLERANRG